MADNGDGKGARHQNKNTNQQFRMGSNHQGQTWLSARHSIPPAMRMVQLELHTGMMMQSRWANPAPVVIPTSPYHPPIMPAPNRGPMGPALPAAKVAEERPWWKSCASLMAFQEENGHCNVPRTYEKDPSLASWVTNQRSLKASGEIDKAREEVLDRMGFEWVVGQGGQQHWADAYKQLKDYREQNGDLMDLPQKKPKLYLWSHLQRTKKAIGKLLPHQAQLLQGIGFFDPTICGQEIEEESNKTLFAKTVAMAQQLLDQNGGEKQRPEMQQAISRLPSILDPYVVQHPTTTTKESSEAEEACEEKKRAAGSAEKVPAKKLRTEVA